MLAQKTDLKATNYKLGKQLRDVQKAKHAKQAAAEQEAKAQRAVARQLEMQIAMQHIESKVKERSQLHQVMQNSAAAQAEEEERML